jgi:hypothetical protein
MREHIRSEYVANQEMARFVGKRETVVRPRRSRLGDRMRERERARKREQFWVDCGWILLGGGLMVAVIAGALADYLL